MLVDQSRTDDTWFLLLSQLKHKKYVDCKVIRAFLVTVRVFLGALEINSACVPTT